MKLHLPQGLRTALLTCISAVTAIGSTLSTATLVGGALAVSLSGQAMADIEITGETRYNVNADETQNIFLEVAPGSHERGLSINSDEPTAGTLRTLSGSLTVGTTGGQVVVWKQSAVISGPVILNGTMTYGYNEYTGGTLTITGPVTGSAGINVARTVGSNGTGSLILNSDYAAGNISVASNGKLELGSDFNYVGSLNTELTDDTKIVSAITVTNNGDASNISTNDANWQLQQVGDTNQYYLTLASTRVTLDSASTFDWDASSITLTGSEGTDASSPAFGAHDRLEVSADVTGTLKEAVKAYSVTVNAGGNLTLQQNAGTGSLTVDVLNLNGNLNLTTNTWHNYLSVGTWNYGSTASLTLGGGTDGNGYYTFTSNSSNALPPDYTGKIIIKNGRLEVRSDVAYSHVEVQSGSTLNFWTNTTFAGDVTISGKGHDSNKHGALTFDTSATITGTVTVKGADTELVVWGSSQATLNQILLEEGSELEINRRGSSSSTINITGGISGTGVATLHQGTLNMMEGSTISGTVTLSGGTLTTRSASVFTSGAVVTVAEGKDASSTLVLDGWAQNQNASSDTIHSLRYGTSTADILDSFTGNLELAGGTILYVHSQEFGSTAQALPYYSTTVRGATSMLKLDGVNLNDSVTLSGGQLAVWKSTVAGTLNIEEEGGTFKAWGTASTSTLSASVTGSGNLTIDTGTKSNTIIHFNPESVAQYTGQITLTGSGTVKINGSGGTNPHFANGLTIQDGRLEYTSTSDSCDALSLNGGTLLIRSNGSHHGLITLTGNGSSNSGNAIVSVGNWSAIRTDVTGTGNLTLGDSDDTIDIYNAIRHTGTLTLATPTVNLKSGSELRNQGDINISTGTVNVGEAQITNGGDINLSGGELKLNGDSATTSNKLGNTGNINITGGKLTVRTGTLENGTGQVYVKGGTLRFENNATVKSTINAQTVSGEGASQTATSSATFSSRADGYKYQDVEITNTGLTSIWSGAHVKNANILIEQDYELSGGSSDSYNLSLEGCHLTIEAALRMDSKTTVDANTTFAIGESGSLIGSGQVLTGSGHSLAVNFNHDSLVYVETQESTYGFLTYTEVSSLQLSGVTGAEGVGAEILLSLSGANFEALTSGDSKKDILLVFKAPTGTFSVETEDSGNTTSVSGLTFQLDEELTNRGYTIGKYETEHLASTMTNGEIVVYLTTQQRTETDVIPEPATATLSLLALAALAARRRRK